MNLDWIEVSGSARIVAKAYDADSETIYVRFPNNGVEWYYSMCPPNIWDEFCAPGVSHGGYIAQVLNLKPNGRHN